MLDVLVVDGVLEGNIEAPGFHGAQPDARLILSLVNQVDLIHDLVNYVTHINLFFVNPIRHHPRPILLPGLIRDPI